MLHFALSVQEWRYDEGQRTFDVHLVEHKERWSDLKYYMYVPREDRRSAASGTGTFGGTYGQLRTEAEKVGDAMMGLLGVVVVVWERWFVWVGLIVGYVVLSSLLTRDLLISLHHPPPTHLFSQY